MTDECNISDKLKVFLTKKLEESKLKIRKLKRKRKIYKILIVSTACGSIVISAVLASISTLALPPVVIPILLVNSAILTAVSAKFNFDDKALKLGKEIEKTLKIQAKLDYVISCNGDLTKDEYKLILAEFN